MNSNAMIPTRVARHAFQQALISKDETQLRQFYAQYAPWVNTQNVELYCEQIKKEKEKIDQQINEEQVQEIKQ